MQVSRSTIYMCMYLGASSLAGLLARSVTLYSNDANKACYPAIEMNLGDKMCVTVQRIPDVSRV